VADLGENLISAAPECQPLVKFRCARGGSHAVKVSFGVLVMWDICTGFRFLFAVRFGKAITFLQLTCLVNEMMIIQVRYTVAFEFPFYATKNYC